MPYYFNRPLTKGLLRITVEQEQETTSNTVRSLLQRELAIRKLILVQDKAMLDDITALKKLLNELNVEDLKICEHPRTYRSATRKGYSAIVCEECGAEFMGDDATDSNNALERARAINRPPKAKTECLADDPESHKWDMDNTRTCLRCNVSFDIFWDNYLKLKKSASPAESKVAEQDKIEQAIEKLDKG